MLEFFDDDHGTGWTFTDDPASVELFIMADGCLCNFQPPIQFIFLMRDVFIKEKLNALYYLSACRDSKKFTLPHHTRC
jgi:hypothetical protein